MLVSHFMLDLQDTHQRKAAGLNSNDPLQFYSWQGSMHSWRVAPNLGSLAARIEPSVYDIAHSEWEVTAGSHANRTWQPSPELTDSDDLRNTCVFEETCTGVELQ